MGRPIGQQEDVLAFDIVVVRRGDTGLEGRLVDDRETRRALADDAQFARPGALVEVDVFADTGRDDDLVRVEVEPDVGSRGEGPEANVGRAGEGDGDSVGGASSGRVSDQIRMPPPTSSRSATTATMTIHQGNGFAGFGGGTWNATVGPETT